MQFNEISLTDKLFKNLPAVIFSTTLFIRLLLAVPIGIVAVGKFAFFGTFTAYLLGIGSTIALEVLLTVLSIINANFRKNKMLVAAGWMLFIVLSITAYNSYLLQGITAFYTVEEAFLTLLTLHVLNVVSIVLMEAMAFISVGKSQQVDPMPEQKKESGAVKQAITETPIIYSKVRTAEEIKNSFDSIDSKIIQLDQLGTFGTRKEIAAYLFTNQSKVTRVLNMVRN